MMSLKTDFNLIDTYKLFICNKDEKQGVNLRQIEETFGFFHLYPTREEMTLLMVYYDLDEDGKLTQTEFNALFLPRDTHYASILLNRLSNFIEPNPLTP